MREDQQACETTGQAIRARDPTALRQLVEDHLDPLFAFVFHRVDRDRIAAEELVQETFLHAVRSAGRLRGESTAWTWICGIARKLILGRLTGLGLSERLRHLRAMLQALPAQKKSGIAYAWVRAAKALTAGVPPEQFAHLIDEVAGLHANDPKITAMLAKLRTELGSR